ncbi:hypothetical protein CC86DRAFT_300315 [Ophiobolus disseminans]|uniref:Rhodopsin domain-containing protein n=1 Tax=Ophiobolus disseminans TaxID=1469910 RepID=A0A6A6ZNE9_9PLEO|nr:hypothetical protein CC86DRAFT_300315 [Ophiobolus disseminans]
MTLTHKVTAEAILFVAATIVVGLRFHARRKMKVGLKADDWLSLAAWVLLTAHMACLFWGEYNYLQIRRVDADRAAAADQNLSAANMVKMKLPQILQLLKLMFVNIYLMTIIITLCRLSIIVLYHRIFGVYDGFRRALWVMAALSMGWVIAMIFLNTFRCKPIALAYNPRVKGKCLNLNTLFVWSESINCALDLALVLLPLWRISFLHLSIRDRVGLSLVFLTGGFVCITSVLRIVFTYNLDSVQSAFWLSLQLSFAVICSCLPTLRSYLPKHIPTPTTISSYIRSAVLKRSAQRSEESLEDEVKDLNR